MIIKMQPGEKDSNILKNISKKIHCPDHGENYLFKCEYPTCQLPFICSSLQCIQDHYHEDKITMTKFNIADLAKKFYEVQMMMHDDTIVQNARVLKSHIDGLKESIKTVYIEIRKVNQNYDYLKGNFEAPLNLEYIKRVEEYHNISQSLKNSITNLKQNVKIQFPLKDSYFCMKGPLIEFLTESIEDFSWTKCHELYSSKNDLITCEKFHESFQGLSNLIFIFIGETRIIGSFFSCKYPSMNNRLKKDENSFIFISKSNSSEFIKYNACKEAEHHISISEKTFICQGNTPSYGDGIRTFHKNFEELLFCLPTNTYLCTEKDMETESGTLKVRRFMILQVPQEKTTESITQE